MLVSFSNVLFQWYYLKLSEAIQLLPSFVLAVTMVTGIILIYCEVLNRVAIPKLPHSLSLKAIIKFSEHRGQDLDG